MRKIVITGISGTGKSTLGRWLERETGLTLYHMDAIIWGPNWTERSESAIRSALKDISTKESWIVEGWIDFYSKDILQRSDIILYLDYPGWLAAYGGVQRWWRYKGRNRPEMPEGCEESFDLGYLRTMLMRKERPHIEAVLAETPTANVVRVRSRREATVVLSELAPKVGKS